MNNKLRKLLHILLVFAIVFVAVFVCCGVADARAGGGHSYSGGGSSGGSGGGGALGRIISRILVDCIFKLCEDHPLIGYPIVVLLLCLIIYGYFFGKDDETEKQEDDGELWRPSSSKIAKESSAASNKAAFSKIRTKDPDFSEAIFLQRAKKAFMLIQAAWEKRDMGKAQAFLADGTYERFNIQLDFYKKAHVIDVIENLNIVEASVIGFESNHNIDSAFVSITASAKNYRANENSRKFIEGDKKPKQFTEIWTFIRRTGAKNLKSNGLIEGYCPNCGTPIALGRHAQCESCGALLRSGQHDWVVANITQAEEWCQYPNNQIPGVGKYYAFDPGFNIQHIEDRTAVIFWRKVAADTNGVIEILRKMAIDKYCDSLREEYKNPKGRQYFNDCAIGSIQVIGLDATTNENDDKLYVKVIWSGIPANSLEADSGVLGSFSKMFKTKKNISSVFVLKRKRGVMTDVKTGLCAAPCPSCGAAESNSLSNSCEYCGHIMNTGTRDWVLEDILDLNSEEFKKVFSKVKMASLKPIKSVKSQTPQTPQHNPGRYDMNKQAAPNINEVAMATAAMVQNMNNSYGNSMPVAVSDKFKWAIAMMLANGEIHENEMRIIHEYAASLGVSSSTVDDLVKEINTQNNPVGYIAQFTELAYDSDLMHVIVRIAFADGKVTAEELTLLRYIGKRMNMNEDTLKSIFLEEKNLFNQSQK